MFNETFHQKNNAIKHKPKEETMRTKHNLSLGLVLILFICFAVFISLHTVSADDTTMEVTQEPAQGQHAQNLADTAALEDPQVIEFRDFMELAEEALNAAIRTGDEVEIGKAQAAYDSAKANYADAFAAAQEASRSDINEMRSSGLGWGDIAHALGIHPGVLGLGHAKKQSQEENQYSYQTKTQKQTKMTTSHQTNGFSSTKGNNKDKSGDKGDKGKGNDGGKGKK